MNKLFIDLSVNVRTCIKNKRIKKIPLRIQRKNKLLRMLKNLEKQVFCDLCQAFLNEMSLSNWEEL